MTKVLLSGLARIFQRRLTAISGHRITGVRARFEVVRTMMRKTILAIEAIEPEQTGDEMNDSLDNIVRRADDAPSPTRA